MQRILTEVLYLYRGFIDLVYIIEVVEEEQEYRIYTTYGRRLDSPLHTKLVLRSDDFDEVGDYYAEAVAEMLRKNYQIVENGEHITIPGFNPNRDIANMEAPVKQFLAPREEEHDYRKITL